MTVWEVELLGDERDLEHLAAHFNDANWHIYKDATSGQIYMRLQPYAVDVTADAVKSAARESVQELSGILKLIRQSRRPLNAGPLAQLQPDGSRCQILHAADAIEITAQLGVPTVFITDENGNLLQQPPAPPATLKLANLMKNNSALAKAVRLNAASDTDTWGGLYKIMEVVKVAVGGESILCKKGWTSQRQLKRFTVSANHPAISGDASRHGAMQGTPPSNPMLLMEAQSYIQMMLQAWIAEKLGEAGP